MSNKDLSSTVEGEMAQLEVQDAETGEWKAAGSVLLASSADAPSNTAPPVSANTTTTARAQLPKVIKQYLAPGTSKKEERKHYFTFRHAPTSQPNTNLLVLLHGAGDSHKPFDCLAQQMALPQTATLAISARNLVPLPFELGYTWFAEMNYQTGETLALDDPQRLDSLSVATKWLQGLLNLLVEEYLPAERIILLGYGTGATVAMQTCFQRRAPCLPLGGCVCVGGGSAVECDKGKNSDQKSDSTNKTDGTPILILTGSRNSSFYSPRAAQQHQKDYHRAFDGNVTLVSVHVEPGKDQGMISTSREMHKVMEFLAPKLARVSKLPGSRQKGMR